MTGPFTCAEIPGLKLVMTVGETFAAEPGLRLASMPSKVQISPAGHVVGVATLAGGGVTAENDHALVYASPGGPPQILIREGDFVSDFNGKAMLITAFNEAFVDRFGTVATRVNLTRSVTGRTQGILRWTTPHVEVIAYEGQDIEGETLQDVNSLWLTSQGQLRFLGLARNNHESTAFYSDRPGPDSAVLAATLPYAGLPEGAWFGGFAGPAAYNNAGQIFCYANVWSPSGAIGGSSAVDGGLYLYTGARIVHVLSDRPKPVAPGLADKPVISHTHDLWLAEDGWMMFAALLEGPGVTVENERALYAAFGDSIELVARNGSLAPGTPGSHFGYPFHVDGLISRGRLLFENTLALSSGEKASSLWRWDNGQSRELAEAWQPVTESDGQPVKRFKWKGIAPTGRIVFATDFGARLGAPTGSAFWVVDGDAEPLRLLSDGDAMPLRDGGVATIRSVSFFEMTGNQRFDDRGRFLAGLAPEGTGGASLVWVDPSALLPVPPGRISGTVYQDTDEDREISAGDEGLGGVRVELYYADGAGDRVGERLASAETVGDGNYAFADNEPGNYVVIETNLPGYESASDSEGGNDDRVRVELTAAQPSSERNDFLDYFSVPTATLTLHRLEPDAAMNLEEGKSFLSGLVPVEDLDRLARLPEVSRGWVADDVTPLILRATFRPEDLKGNREIRWRVTDSDDDGMDPPLSHYLHAALGKCDLPESGVNNVGPDCPIALALFFHVPEGELRFREGASEIRATVVVEDVLTGSALAERTVALRRPPVFLIHGYNSTGDWGVEFRQALATEGRPFNQADESDNFVRTIRYGQKEFWESDKLPARMAAYLEAGSPDLAFGIVHRENTLLPLEALVPLLQKALQQELEAVREDWAITRYDVVAHGQGGVLARMLASVGGREGFPPPFRDLDNFYRGRFRQVVTIGSPHNGSRLFAFLRQANMNRVLTKRLPPEIVSLGIFSDKVQAKFDPFGDQVFRLNLSFASNPWKPDPLAAFHKVGATIGLLRPPGSNDITPIAVALGLNGPAGTNVFPSGYDGIVDFTSMVGHETPAEASYSSFFNAYLSFQDIYAAHSEPVELFAPGRLSLVYPQTEYPVMGEYISRLLIPREGQVEPFGPFQTPQLLNSEEKAKITRTANEVFAAYPNGMDGVAVLESVLPGRTVGLSGTQPAAEGGVETVFRYRLDATDRLAGSEVFWSAAAMGPGGLNQTEIIVTPVAGEPDRVDVSVPDSLLGDVVLYARYTVADGRAALIQPALVASKNPAGAGIEEIAVLPPAGEYPAGEYITPQLLVAYSDGTVMHRYVTEDNLTALSSDPAVVDVSDPISWQLVQPGQAAVTISYRGHSATSELTVRVTAPVDQSLWMVSCSLEDGTFRVSVPTLGESQLTLWRTRKLEDAEWTEVPDAIVAPAAPGVVTLSDPNPDGVQGFYRVMSEAPVSAE